MFSIVLISSIVGFALLSLSFLIPDKQIEKHSVESANTFSNMTNYPVLFSWCTSQLDYYTEGVLILNALTSVDSNCFNRAAMMYRYQVEDESPLESLVSVYNTNTPSGIISYSRYWHGYIVLLKPLFCIFSVDQIWCLNGIVQIILFLTCSIGLFLSKRGAYIIPFTLTYLFLNPIVLANCIDLSICYCIYAVSCIIIMLFEYKKIEYQSWLFCVIGVFTSYFDLLTYPVVTLGIPLSIFVCIKRRRILDVLEKIVQWIFCYVGMWATKWIIVYLFFDKTIFENVYNQILIRSSSKDYLGVSYSALDCIYLNLKTFFYTPAKYLYFIIIGILMIVLVFVLFCHKSRNVDMHYNIIGILNYTLICILPLGWYCFTINHSTTHAFFTNKEWCIVIMCSIAALIGIIQNGINSNKSQ